MRRVLDSEMWYNQWIKGADVVREVVEWSEWDDLTHRSSRSNVCVGTKGLQCGRK